MTEQFDRIEAVLASVTESQQRTQQQQEANAAAISTLGQRQDRFQQQMEESDHRLRESIVESDRSLRESINDVVLIIGTLAEQQAEFRQQKAESNQRFENLLNHARADRALNEQEHRAFRETFQTLLAEISRIWQRLAG
ncbi:MAG: hypothetical protein F6K42_12420 [Leptolyngbya sp. SIO1D8]|nr:hypothetical protein [Leptolyngbya sp. SIO1D8]